MAKGPKSTFGLLVKCIETKDSRNLRKLLKISKFLELINNTDDSQQTLLHMGNFDDYIVLMNCKAVKQNDHEIVDILLEHDIDCVNQKDSTGYTALHLSSEL